MNPESPQSGKRGSKSGRAGATSGTAGFDSSVQPQTLGSEVNAGVSARSESTRGVAGEAAQQASGLYNQVRDKAASQLNAQKDVATAGLGSVASAVRRSTQQLREEHHETVADLVERVADQIERFSAHLRDRDLNELVDEAQQFARRQPAVFIGTSFAAGLLAARFVKASRPERFEDRTRSYGADPSGSPSYGSGSYGSGTYEPGSSFDRPGQGTGATSSFNTFSDRPGGADVTGRGGSL